RDTPSCGGIGAFDPNTGSLTVEASVAAPATFANVLRDTFLLALRRLLFIYLLTARGGYARPVVSSKRRSGKACLVVKIRNRVVGPCITDRNRLRDFRARDDHRVALDARVSPDKMVIVTGNRKTFHWTTISRLQTAGVLEADAYF